jgi:hypothetical protein
MTEEDLESEGAVRRLLVGQLLVGVSVVLLDPGFDKGGRWGLGLGTFLLLAAIFLGLWIGGVIRSIDLRYRRWVYLLLHLLSLPAAILISSIEIF